VWGSLRRSGHLEGEPGASLAGRLRRMRNWVDGPHFPDAARVEVQERVSDEVCANLTSEQKRFLAALSDALAECEWTDSAIGDCIRTVAAEIGIGARDAYIAIYWVMLGKSHGPRASSIINEIGYEQLAGLLGLGK